MSYEAEQMQNLKIAIKNLTPEIKKLNENMDIFRQLTAAIEKQNALLEYQMMLNGQSLEEPRRLK